MVDTGVGIVTALGMGTVFVCLLLLYVTTRILGMLLAPKSQPAAPTAADGGANRESSDASAAPIVDDSQAILAAMTLVLARHRAARTKSVSATAGGDDPWKIAGRIRMLRTE